MCFNDLFHILFPNAHVKGSLWIYGYGRAEVADAKAAALIGPYLKAWVQRIELLLEFGHELEPMCFATAEFFGAAALIVAHKDVHIENRIHLFTYI